jgi:hypothetical protein
VASVVERTDTQKCIGQSHMRTIVRAEPPVQVQVRAGEYMWDSLTQGERMRIGGTAGGLR